jgi:hypothetical protein
MLRSYLHCCILLGEGSPIYADLGRVAEMHDDEIEQLLSLEMQAEGYQRRLTSIASLSWYASTSWISRRRCLSVGVTSIDLTSRKNSFLHAAELCLLNVISPACDEDFCHLHDDIRHVVHEKKNCLIVSSKTQDIQETIFSANLHWAQEPPRKDAD